jgi:4-hydroxy-tetrahydrodipicolinate reductase
MAKGHEIVGRIAHDSDQKLTAFSKENAEVAIEFTHPEAAFDNIKYCWRITFR